MRLRHGSSVPPLQIFNVLSKIAPDRYRRLKWSGQAHDGRTDGPLGLLPWRNAPSGFPRSTDV